MRIPNDLDEEDFLDNDLLEEEAYIADSDYGFDGYEDDDFSYDDTWGEI